MLHSFSVGDDEYTVGEGGRLSFTISHGWGFSSSMYSYLRDELVYIVMNTTGMLDAAGLPTPCLSSSKHHAVCMSDECLDLIKLYATNTSS